jgi:hypothetical protein
MAYFLFIDESGHDELRLQAPCDVLAGICVEDKNVWPLINAIIALEDQFFGCRYGHLKEEFKGKKFLKRKVFRHAAQEAAIEESERRNLAHACIVDGATADRRQITALAQAKLAFVDALLRLVLDFKCCAVASVVLRDAPTPGNDVLRKDYAYLFERFFYFVQDRGPTAQGIIVFDELEKTQSKILLGQMEEYFLKFSRGKERAQYIIPQPFFVHSDLTTLIQVADLIAYIIARGYEINNSFLKVTREELRPCGELVLKLRYDARRFVMGKASFLIYGYALIDDLRSADEKLP